MKRLWFTLFNSGMKIRLYRNGGQQKAQEKQKLKAVVTALHKDDDTFDVMFTEPGFEGKMQGGNHIDDVEIVISQLFVFRFRYENTRASHRGGSQKGIHFHCIL